MFEISPFKAELCFLNQVYLKDLVLDDHARKKMISLVGPRYSADTDELTIVADRYRWKSENNWALLVLRKYMNALVQKSYLYLDR